VYDLQSLACQCLAALHKVGAVAHAEGAAASGVEGEIADAGVAGQAGTAPGRRGDLWVRAKVPGAAVAVDVAAAPGTEAAPVVVDLIVLEASGAGAEAYDRADRTDSSLAAVPEGSADPPDGSHPSCCRRSWGREQDLVAVGSERERPIEVLVGRQERLAGTPVDARLGARVRRLD